MSTVRTVTVPASELRHRFETYEVHPPLYFAQLKIWMKVVGKSLVCIRADSAFWGSLGLLLMYVLASHYGDAGAGLLAMILMGLSPLYLSYSQEARPYALGMALGIASLLALEKLILCRKPSSPLEGEDSGGGQVLNTAGTPHPAPSPSRGEGKGWIFLSVLWTCLLYTHYWGSFVVAAQGAYGIWKAPSRDDRRAVLFAFFAACAVFCLWVPILWTQMHVIGGLAFWMPTFSLAQLFKPLMAFSGLYFNVASFAFYVPTKVWILLGFGLIFAAALIAGFRRGPRAAVFWLVLGLIVPWILSYWSHSMYLWYRYPTLMFPAFVLLITAGLLSFKPPALRASLIAICLASQLWGCWFYFSGWQKANPKMVVQYIHDLHEPDCIVVRPFYFGELFNFYDRGTLQTLDQHVLDSPEKRAALRGKRIVLIAFDVQSDPITLALLNEYQIVSMHQFPAFAHLGIRVYQLQ